MESYSYKSNSPSVIVSQDHSNLDDLHNCVVNIDEISKPNGSRKVMSSKEKTYSAEQVQAMIEGLNVVSAKQQSHTTPICDPTPLGLCSFALSCFVLSMMNAGAIADLRKPSSGVALALALFVGGLAEFLAGMWEFQVGNILGATAFSAFGGFWFSVAAMSIESFGFLNGYGTDVDALNTDLGIYFLGWAILCFLFLIASHRSNLVLVMLFFTVWLLLLLLSIGRFCGGDLYLQRAGGIVGIIASFIGWYGALALMINEKNSLFVLPMWPMDPIYEYFGIIKSKSDKCH